MATSKKKRAPTKTKRSTKTKRATAIAKKTAPRSAGRRFTESELAELSAAWEARDGETLERVSRRAGVVVTVENVDAINAMSSDLYSCKLVLAKIGEALESSAGLAIEEKNGWGITACLVATNGDTLVVAFGHLDKGRNKLAAIWPRLGRWFQDLRRNRARVDAWLASKSRDSRHARGRVVLALVPPDANANDAAQLAQLRAAIVAAPDDDTPRLVLADLLQQRDDPRGDLIALQCKVVQIREGRTPELIEVERRVHTLLFLHRERFAGDVARCVTDYEIDRGFVSCVTMNASSFAANGDRLFSQDPIETLRLRPMTSEAIAKLAATPALARVRHLVLRCEYGEQPVRWIKLAKSPHLQALEILDLKNVKAEPRDWVKAFASLAAPKLRRIIVEGLSLSIAALAALAANPMLPVLEDLEVDARGGTSENDRATQQLFAALAMRTTLRRLKLQNCARFDAAAISTLFAGPGGRKLHDLSIDDRAFDDAALAVMTAAPLELRELELRHASVSRAALDAFVKSRSAAPLDRIEISDCPNVSPRS